MIACPNWSLFCISSLSQKLFEKDAKIEALSQMSNFNEWVENMMKVSKLSDYMSFQSILNQIEFKDFFQLLLE